MLGGCARLGVLDHQVRQPEFYNPDCANASPVHGIGLEDQPWTWWCGLAGAWCQSITIANCSVPPSRPHAVPMYRLSTIATENFQHARAGALR